MKLIIIAGLAGLGSLVGLTLMFENRMIFFPSKYPEGLWNPNSMGIHVKDCYFTTSDNVRLHGWLYQQPDAKTLLIFCHGNAGNLTHRLENMVLLGRLGLSVFIFDYRGYGRSEGKPTEQGINLDAQAAYDYLKSKGYLDTLNVVVFGRSLGAAAALDLALHRECHGLILESPFLSGKEMSKRMMPFFPIRFFMRSRYENNKKIERIRLPLLVLHGNKDSVIPFKQGKALFELANEPKRFYTIEGADHNDTYETGGEPYFGVWKEFIEDLQPSCTVP